MQFFLITWPTYNTRESERMRYYNVRRSSKCVVLGVEQRQKVFELLCEKVLEKKYKVLTMNVLDDHVHVLIVCEREELNEIVRVLKGYSSFWFHRDDGVCSNGLKPIVSEEKREGRSRRKLWGQKFGVRYILSESHLSNAYNYVENNHVKHKLVPLKLDKLYKIRREDGEI